MRGRVAIGSRVWLRKFWVLGGVAGAPPEMAPDVERIAALSDPKTPTT